MTKFVSKIFAILAVALVPMTSVMAQFSTQQGSSDTDTKVTIRQTGPNAAELTFNRVKVVYLNKDPKIEGIKPQPDVSKKGQVWVVPIALAPEVAGADVTFTGVGSSGWGVGPGNRVDPDKTKSAKLAETFMLPITISGKDKNGNPAAGCAAFTFLATKDGVVIDMKHLWISHPGNSSYLFKNGGNGQTDMATLLCTDKEGSIAAGTPEQAKAYAPIYTANTALKMAKK